MSAVNAADVYSRGSIKDEPPVAYLPAITWTGFYVGAHVGSTFDAQNTLSDGVVELVQDLDDTGLAGFQLGYNWQTSRHLVLGVEGDMSFPFDDIGVDYFGTIRGRVGFAADRALFYGTGGVAFLADDADETVTGYTVGLGMDYKLRENVSFGVEGLYYNFEDDLGGGIEQELDFWTVRARLNYHLGGGYREQLK